MTIFLDDGSKHTKRRERAAKGAYPDVFILISHSVEKMRVPSKNPGFLRIFLVTNTESFVVFQVTSFCCLAVHCYLLFTVTAAPVSVHFHLAGKDLITACVCECRRADRFSCQYISYLTRGYSRFWARRFTRQSCSGILDQFEPRHIPH